jgi:hypothetical protein
LLHSSFYVSMRKTHSNYSHWCPYIKNFFDRLIEKNLDNKKVSRNKVLPADPPRQSSASSYCFSNFSKRLLIFSHSHYWGLGKKGGITENELIGLEILVYRYRLPLWPCLMTSRDKTDMPRPISPCKNGHISLDILVQI